MQAQAGSDGQPITPSSPSLWLQGPGSRVQGALDAVGVIRGCENAPPQGGDVAGPVRRKRMRAVQRNPHVSIRNVTNIKRMQAQAGSNGEQGPTEAPHAARHGAPPLATFHQPSATLETTQGKIDGFFSQLPFKFYLLEVASVGD